MRFRLSGVGGGVGSAAGAGGSGAGGGAAGLGGGAGIGSSSGRLRIHHQINSTTITNTTIISSQISQSMPTARRLQWAREGHQYRATCQQADQDVAFAGHESTSAIVSAPVSMRRASPAAHRVRQ